MYFLIQETENIISNGSNDCLSCLKELFFENPENITTIKNCIHTKKLVRRGYKKFDEVFISLCVFDNPDSTRLFKEKINAIKDVYQSLQPHVKELYENEKREIAQRFKDFSHNVITYNAKIVQAPYLFIPHDALLQQEDKLTFIKECIRNNLDDAANSFLAMLKGAELTKHEFATYDILHNQATPDIKMESHKIHKLIQMALNVFWKDFYENKININNGKCNLCVDVDFKSFMPALVHITNNMSKYVCPNTTIDITYSKENSSVIVQFSMLSFCVFPNEIDKIWEKNYSGKIAKLMQKDGGGLGMYFAKKLIELNKGEILFYNGSDYLIKNDTQYAWNREIIKAPLSHQSEP